MHRASIFSLLSLALLACANGITDGGGAADDVLVADAGAPGKARTDGGAHDAAVASADDAGPGDASSTVPGDANQTDAAATGTAGDASPDATVVIGAQWETPVCDGTIGVTEYGAADNHGASGAQTWYVTWDATNLYVAVDGANLAEGVVLYVGHTGSGLMAGQAYDLSRAQTLPFAADAVVYAKQGYTEVRTPSSGAWGAASVSAATFCGKGTTRETVIAWSALGASGMPKGFRWLGYAVSASGYAYAQEPTTLPSGFIGQSAVFPRQLHVTSTANGTGTFPFQLVE